MKVVILAGGLGTRLSEETSVIPKPMVEIGGRPILWHIMKIYSHYGCKHFVICLGYKGEKIREYFAHYHKMNSDVTFSLVDGHAEYHNYHPEPWEVTLVDTGQDTLTGGRLKRIAEYINPYEPFFMTYGDGLANVDMRRLLILHNKCGREATVTAVRPPIRFGTLSSVGNEVIKFQEKPEVGWINGGFFVLEPSVLDRIDGDEIIFEEAPLRSLAADGQLSVYKHDGFWKCMDTLHDKVTLERMWRDDAPWKVW